MGEGGLLLGGEEGGHQVAVAAGDPADADAGHAVGLRERRDADHAVAEDRGGRVDLVGQLAIGLVEEEPGAGALDHADDLGEVGLRDDGAGRVMWAGQADELRFRSDQGGEAVEVDLVAGVEGELEVGDIGVDRPGRLEVASVVGAGDDEAIAGAEQGGRGQEEGAGRTDRDEDVVRGQGAAAVGGDLRSEAFRCRGGRRSRAGGRRGWLDRGRCRSGSGRASSFRRG